jgi:chitinase
LNDCAGINPGIKTCQTNGKKVFLSLGGGFPTDQYFFSQASAEAFADFLWGAFGPQDAAWVSAGKPRPFTDAAVDGFDFDIESNFFGAAQKDANGNTVVKPESFGYNFMIDRLRSHYAASSGAFYISGAPQCIIDDAHLAPAIADSWFDFLFVQLYNTPECSARAAVSGVSTFPLAAWTSVAATKSANPNVKIYLGLVRLLTSLLSVHLLTQHLARRYNWRLGFYILLDSQ